MHHSTMQGLIPATIALSQSSYYIRVLRGKLGDRRSVPPLPAEICLSPVYSHGKSGPAITMSLGCQPLQGFGPAFENRKFAPGKGLQTVTGVFRKTLGTDPSRFLDIRFVEDSGFLHGTQGLLVKGCAGEV